MNRYKEYAMALTIISSIVHGEQLRLNFDIGWIADLSSYSITARIVEGTNSELGDIPTDEDTASLVIVPLTVVNVSGSTFQVVIPSTLLDGWTVIPSPDRPVYGYFDVSLDDNGSGAFKQIFKPVQGLIEISYSPLESAA